MASTSQESSLNWFTDTFMTSNFLPPQSEDPIYSQYRQDAERLAQQSKEVAPGVFRRYEFAEGLLDNFKGAKTSHEIFIQAVQDFGSRDCLGYRVDDDTPFRFSSYSEIFDRVKKFGSGLRQLGLGVGERLGVYSKNRVEYTIAVEACNGMALTLTTLYDTLGAEAIEYICNHAELKAVVCSEDTVPKLAAIANKVPNLRYIIFLGTSVEAAVEEQLRASAPAVKLIAFTEVERLGAENIAPFTPPTPDDIALLMYTSGTTGTPKGVLLQHRAIAAMTGSMARLFSFRPEEVLLSYLPLAHIFERVVESCILANGGSIGYFRGDFRKHMLKDMGSLRPTVLPLVPRVLETIRNGALEKVEGGSWIAKTLFQRAMFVKMEALKKNSTVSLYDATVFSKFKEIIGGRVRYVVSGGAYLRPELQQFARCVFSVPVIQGYGLTETTASGLFNDARDLSNGTIGAPTPSIEVRLAPCEDMGYSMEKNKSGEIWLRGASVCQGYYKNAEATAEVFTEDGWFKTGDVGRLNPNGSFSIIDRKKNMIKLPQGEYVALEKLENTYSKSDFVDQLAVHAELDKDFLVAVVVPKKPNLCRLADSLTIPAEPYADLLKNPAIVGAVLKNFSELAKQDKLAGFEQVKNILLTDTAFTVENDLVTPSMKVKRPNIKTHFGADLQKLFTSAPPK